MLPKLRHVVGSLSSSVATPNPAVQGTLRDKASRSAPDLERWASEMSYTEDVVSIQIESAFAAWAAKNRLQITDREQWDAISRSVFISDSGGDWYEVYASVNCELSDSESERMHLAVAGASLVKRGQAKHRAFRRERERYSIRRVVALEELAVELDVVHKQVQIWITEAGHSL